MARREDEVRELCASMREMIEIYRDDPRDCADADQPECIRRAVLAVEPVETLTMDPLRAELERVPPGYHPLIRGNQDARGHWFANICRDDSIGLPVNGPLDYFPAYADTPEDALRAANDAAHEALGIGFH
jgi:hypothetical protein